MAIFLPPDQDRPGMYLSPICFMAQAGASTQVQVSVLRSLWNGFNDVLSFTANLWQNLDSLAVMAIGVYLLVRLGKSVLGHDESTVKTSTSFDYLGEFPRESDQKVFRLEEVWKLPFHEKTVRACFANANDVMPFVCIPNRGVWLELHDFYSGLRNSAAAEAVDLRRDRSLRRVSHVLGISFGNYEMRQPRIEDLPAPKLLDILRDPVKEFQKAALSSRELEMARQLALLELASLVCWKAPHLVNDALMEPELTPLALRNTRGASPIEKKLTLERQLAEAQKAQVEALVARGWRMGKLFLLDRKASYEWLNSLGSGNGKPVEIPALSAEETGSILAVLKVHEGFKPWTHRLVDVISQLPFVRNRFPHDEYIQRVGRLEADGWLVRVYVNIRGSEADEMES